MARITWNDKIDLEESTVPNENKVTAADMNQIKNVVNGKQDTLIAGTNITITDNTIAASGYTTELYEIFDKVGSWPAKTKVSVSELVSYSEVLVMVRVNDDDGKSTRASIVQTQVNDSDYYNNVGCYFISADGNSIGRTCMVACSDYNVWFIGGGSGARMVSIRAYTTRLRKV